jgi:hypothetical protein
MAASVAWPRRGEEGSGSQCWHFIEGGRERGRLDASRWVRHANRGEDHIIPIR